MAVYKCCVLDTSGKKHKVSRNADSKAEIINYLKKSNYIVIKAEKSENDLSLDKSLNKLRKVRSKDLAVFCKQLCTMIKAGVTIVSSLEILKKQTENERLQEIIGKIYEDLQRGNTFSEALSNHMDVFPEILVSMVEAGELSGNIDVILDRLSNHFEKEYKVENKIKSAMTYPIILAFVATSVVIFLLTNVMPIFISMYENSGVPLPGITRLMIGMSEGIKNWWYVILLIVFILMIIISESGKKHNVKLKSDYYKLQVPVYKNLALKIAASRFTRTLSTLMGSGVPLLQALDTVAGVTGNAYIESKVIEAKEDVRRGLSLSQTLKIQGVFPPMVHSMIKIGEDSGAIEEILDKTADLYDEEVETAINRFTVILEPLMIVLMAIIIGFIVLAMVIPMFDMVKTVQ